MQIVLPDGMSNCDALRKLRGDNKFTARRIFDLASGDELKLMKDSIRHIDAVQCEAKASSLHCSFDLGHHVVSTRMVFTK